MSGGVDASALGVRQEGERNGDGHCADHDANAKACATNNRGDDRRRQHRPDDGDRTRRLLGEMFEQAPLGHQMAEPRNDRLTTARTQRREQGADGAGQSGGDGEQTDRRSEAEMFAIAFACCRDMLFRLSDQFSLQRMDTHRPD